MHSGATLACRDTGPGKIRKYPGSRPDRDGYEAPLDRGTEAATVMVAVWLDVVRGSALPGAGDTGRFYRLLIDNESRIQ